MTLRSLLPRVVPALVAALLAGAFAAPALARPPVAEAFYADSGDACPYGFTEGVLTWQPNGVVDRPGVHLSGRVVDRPTPVEAGLICRPDGLFTVATFTAYVGRTAVDQEVVRVNDGIQSVRFTLGDLVTPRPATIDRVVIQLCRYGFSAPPGAVDYCGKSREYRRAVLGPQP